AAPEPPEQVLAVDEAVEKLAATSPQAAELVKLRYFGGLSNAEAAAVLGVSPRKANQIWAYARAGPGGGLGDGPAREDRPRRSPRLRSFRAQFPPVRRMDLWHPDIAGCGSGPVNEQSLFIEALEKDDPAERAAFLDRACAGVSGLRERIERLLGRHAREGS